MHDVLIFDSWKQLILNLRKRDFLLDLERPITKEENKELNAIVRKIIAIRIALLKEKSYSSPALETSNSLGASNGGEES